MLFCGKVQKVVSDHKRYELEKNKTVDVCVCVKTEGFKICFGELSSTEKVLIIKCSVVYEKIWDWKHKKQ